jgi:uncharacterized protein
MTFGLTVLSLAQAGAVAGPVFAGGGVVVLRRRRRLAAGFLALFAIAYGLAVWGFLIEPGMLVVRQMEIASPQWSGAPLRIGIISDPHVDGPHMGVERMRRVVARMNAENPDIVLLLGDYAAGHEPAAMRKAPEQSRVQRGIATFADLKAPHGVVGIIGNHDAWYDERTIETALARAGVQVVNNSAHAVRREEGAFWIAGLADLESTERRSSVAEAMAEVPPDAPAIFLTHFPDPWPRIPDRVALTLAGHTHCGQVNLPVLGRIVHASRGSKRWPCGLYREGDRQLYVSGGVGVSILPVRFGAPPEIALITLKSQPLLAPASPSH